MDGLRKVSFVALLPICAYLIIGKPPWATALAKSPYSVPTLSIATGGIAVLMGPVAAALVTATGALMMYDVCNARVDRELKIEEIKRRYCSSRFGRMAYRDKHGNPLSPSEIQDRHAAIADGILDCNICEDGCGADLREGFAMQDLRVVKAFNGAKGLFVNHYKRVRDGTKVVGNGVAKAVGLI